MEYESGRWIPCESQRFLTKKGVEWKKQMHADYALEMKAKNKMPELRSTHLVFRTLEYTPWLTDHTKNLCSMQSLIFDHDAVAKGAILIFLSLISSVVCAVKSYIFTVYGLKLSIFCPFPKNKINSCFLVGNS